MAGKDNSYALQRDILGSARLNLFNLWLKEELGYALHPSIAKDIPNDAAICDVGTGTAVWAIDTAKAFPKMSVTGLDISFDQAPPAEWLPSNVKLRLYNVFEQAPDDLVEKFDVVHVGLFVAIPQDGNPRSIMHNILRMLKPGGWIQWCDLDMDTWKCDTARAGLSKEKTDAVVQFHLNLPALAPRYSTRWTTKLGSIMRELGIEVHEDFLISPSPEYKPMYTDHVLMTFHEFSSRMPAGDVKDKYIHLAHEAEKEVLEAKRGIATTLDSRMVIGKKSS